MGVTADEVVHLTGGYAYWRFNDYRLQPENGNLAMRVATLPLLAMPLRFPALTSEDWINSRVDRVGRAFCFQSGNPVAAMFQVARLMATLAGAAAVWLTWRWARGLYGTAAGWLALSLAVFSPTMLAHGALVTSDMALVACALAAISAVWLLLHRLTWLRLLAAILGCGAAFLAKMSGVLVVPVVAGLLLLRLRRRVPLVVALGGQRHRLHSRRAIAVAVVGALLAAGAGSLVVLWAGYGFRYAAANEAVSRCDGLYFSWDVILDREPLPQPKATTLESLVRSLPAPAPTAMTRLIGVLHDHRILPEAYLWGFAHTYKFSRSRPAFLAGHYSRTGWRSFFPLAFLLKTPLPTLLLFATGATVLIFARRGAAPARSWYRGAPLWLFGLLYGALAIASHLNIGQRHILPLYPIVFVVASAAVFAIARLRRGKLTLPVLLIGLLIVDSTAARPFYLSYFQPLTGGPDRGYRWLVDSSFDWGQGLPDMAAWLAERRRAGDRTPVYLSYFGADSPRARQLDVIRFGDFYGDYGERVFPASVHGGWFAVSATQFQRVYLPVRGPWSPSLERLYRELLSRLRSVKDPSPLQGVAREDLQSAASDFELLQFGRLCHYLRDRRPLQIIGGSILLFHLSEAEVRFALYAPWNEFQPFLR